ncbi:ATP-binding protein [Chitinibacter sp. FCG-7]|uniref:histidine kinase n=1 Tax=Chitinibacter mangrovi TaxID=3153927 RepID=A0AAU7FA95_9NEIS
MKRYLDYFGPSLIRRVVLAILLAFALVWVVLALYGYWSETNPAERDRMLLTQGKMMVQVLEKAQTDTEAKMVMATHSDLYNLNYRELQIPRVMLFQLSNAQGRLLYLSPEAQARALPQGNTTLYDIRLNGETYRVFHAKTPRWELMWAVPSLNSFWFFKMVVVSMTIQMLIALPIMILTIWLVVARGLRPLRVLSGTIAAKHRDDLSPLNFASPYAELKPLTTALDHLLDQLRGKIEREHAFVQDAAHELRTPMAVISAQAHVLTLAATPAERKTAEKNLEQAIHRASHLIAQLLDMSHIDNDRLKPDELIDVAALLQRELARLVPAAMARQIELSLNAPDTLPCRTDSNALQTIAQNLLNNAILYVNEGDQIEVQLQVLNACLIVSVADNGPGIAEADRERVFERFYRGAGHDVAGTGLGLAIVAQAVARLNGHISLGSGLGGQGCCFTVTLPYQA